jgi:putative transposase
LDGNQILLAA